MIDFRLRIHVSWSGFSIRIRAVQPMPTQIVPTQCAPAPVPAPDSPVRYGGFIAGFQHYDGQQLLSQLRRGTVLRLVRDRHNPHDANAVRVMIGTRMLGYLPRGPNAEIAKRIDRAEPIVCRIERVKGESRPWKQVEICVESLSIAKPWWGESEMIEEGDEEEEAICFGGPANASGDADVSFENY